MAQITALGNCDVLKEASVHLLKGGRVSGHHIKDLHSFMAECLSRPQLQQFDSMMQRVDTMCAAAHQVRLLWHCIFGDSAVVITIHCVKEVCLAGKPCTLQTVLSVLA